MNWQSLISDLKARQISQAQIAAACNCKQSTISDLATGKTGSPSYELGIALIALHKRRKTVAA
jgi:transcriptional regulator with XRE-family HTH domain